MSAVVPPGSKNAIGVTGCVLGLLGLVSAFVPVVGVVAWPLAILGLIFGITGIERARAGAPNRMPSIAGTALAGLTLLVSIAWIGLLGGPAAEVVGNSPARQAASARTDPAAAPLPFGAAHTWPGGERVRVTAPRTGHGYPLVTGGRVAEVSLLISNGTGHDINPAGWNITARHAGKPAKPLFTDDQLADLPIPAGATVALTRGFEVADRPGTLRISVQPNFLAQQTAHYSCRF